ncbi:MAG: delta-60 repeat domain-containing protein [Bacteroidales bacterium]|nr:delta-60 repeat domain-containing protein [Bacteroidales bacterium]
MKRFFTLMFSSLLFFGVHAQNPGDFDGTFGTDGIVLTPIGTASGMAYDIAVQPDGKIIMAGKASIGTWKFALVRYNIDGTLDESFGDNGIVTTAIAHSDQGISVALQPDGKIVLGGATYDNVDYTGAVVRYFEDGDVDNTFGVDGVAHLSNISFHY